MAAPTFYNQGDQDIYNSGQHFVPQEKYRLGYTPPAAPEVIAPVPGGITNTNAFNNSGGNNFNPAGNAFGYGSPVSEVNVRTFNPQSNDPTGSVASAQEAYNQFGDIKDKSIYSNYADINNQIMDNRQNYQANYNSPYEDSIDLGYQGTLGNNEMYPSEKYPNSFMKGKLNRFKNKVGDAAKFVGGLLPFPLNLATKFLPQGNDNGPGGGTYGIGGLSDDKKAAYNALAGSGMLFDGQNGFKTLTGKNFQAKNYVPNQLEIYNKTQKKQGKSFAEMTEDEIAALTGFQKKQYLEASSMYKTTEKQKKEEEAREQARKNAATAQIRDRTTNIGDVTPGQQAQANADYARIQRAYREDTGGNAGSYSPGGGSGSHAPDASGSTYSDPFDPGGGEKDGGFIDGSNRRPFNSGGRAGYFFGGRVNYKAGGRTDAGPNRTTASKAGVGQINESGQKVSGGNFNNSNDGGGNDNTPTINKFAGSNVIESPFGKLGNTDTEIGYRGGVDLTKLGLTMGVDGTLTNRNFLTNDDIENEGTFYTGTDNDIFNTATNYDNSGIGNTFLNSNTPVGDFGVTVDNNGNLVQGNYENNYKGVDVNATTNFDDLNNISISKFSGDPTKNGFSYGIGANVDPSNLSNSNAYLQARYAFGQGKKDGGRIGFKNGGLASIL